MPTLTDDGQDTRLNHDAWDDTTGRLRTAENESALSEDAFANSTADGSKSDTAARNYQDRQFANNSANSSQEDKNIKEAKNREESSTSGVNKLNSSSGKTSSSSSQSSGGNVSGKLKNFAKKKGAMFLITIILSVVGGGMGLIFTPGLAVVQLTEALKEDLDDAAKALENRQQYLMKKKIKGTTTGICTKKMTARCKYTNMSKKQIEKLRKAGLQVETDGKAISGRQRVKTITLPGNGTDPPVRVTAQNFGSEMKNNPKFSKSVYSAFSPRWMSTADGVVDNIKTKYKLSFTRRLNGTKESMKRQWRNFIKAGAPTNDSGWVVTTDDDGNKVYKDKDGNIQQKNGENIDPDKMENAMKEMKKQASGGSGKSGTNRLGKLGMGAVGGILGAGEIANMGCNILQTMRIAGIAGHLLKHASLMRYAILFANTSDSIKTGDATPEAMELVGDTLSEIDMNELAITDASMEKMKEGFDLGDMQAGNNAEDTLPTPSENPNYGKNAYDSVGARAAIHGASSEVGLAESVASLDGGMGSSMSSWVRDMEGTTLPGGINPFSRSTCDAVKHPVTRGVAMIASVSLAIGGMFLGGVGAAQIATQASIAVSMAVLSMVVSSWVNGQINDLANGDAFDPDVKGVNAGNGYFAGMGAFMGSSASSRGMTPRSTEDAIAYNNQVAFETNQRLAAAESYAARATPFDIYNKYSFLGSMAYNLMPIAQASTKGTAATIAAIPSQLLSLATGGLSSKANAVVRSDPNRFKQCQDPALEDINVKTADIMCNLRFGLNEQQSHADPESVAQWMIDACQIDPYTGEVNMSDECPTEGRDPDLTASIGNSATAMLDINNNQVAGILQGDETTVDSPIITDLTQQEQATTAAKVPFSALGGTGGAYGDGGAEGDVRSYAYFLRFCRYGVDGGREVGFGDEDSLDKEQNAILGFLDADNNLVRSNGRECMESNKCTPGANPNQADPDKKCRPAQYDIYEVFTTDASIEEAMDKDLDETGASSDSSDSTLVTGEMKDLARQVAEHENIEFVDPATKAALLKFADTGEATNFCGQPFTIDPLLSGAMLTNAKKYKILVNNIGFQEDRHLACDNGMHPKGGAVDLNGIKKLDGNDSTAWGSITFGSKQEVDLITEYATDWIDATSSEDPQRGRSGQVGCGGYNLEAIRKPAWKGAPGADGLHFSDACNHLHIDVGDRMSSGG